MSCSGGVELWLGKLLAEMQGTVQSILGVMAMSLTSHDSNFIDDFKEFCGQVS